MYGRALSTYSKARCALHKKGTGRNAYCNMGRQEIVMMPGGIPGCLRNMMLPVDEVPASTMNAKGPAPPKAAKKAGKRRCGIRRASGAKLSPLDMRIISSLHLDVRKPYGEVAKEVGGSAKTVRLHPERMRDEGTVELLTRSDNDLGGDGASDHVGAQRNGEQPQGEREGPQHLPMVVRDMAG